MPRRAWPLGAHAAVGRASRVDGHAQAHLPERQHARAERRRRRLSARLPPLPPRRARRRAPPLPRVRHLPRRIRLPGVPHRLPALLGRGAAPAAAPRATSRSQGCRRDRDCHRSRALLPAPRLHASAAATKAQAQARQEGEAAKGLFGADAPRRRHLARRRPQAQGGRAELRRALGLAQWHALRARQREPVLFPAVAPKGGDPAAERALLARAAAAQGRRHAARRAVRREGRCQGGGRAVGRRREEVVRRRACELVRRV
mmetsp:Transcript_41591/g.134175  ORF Transcript_41591/g.134175 Transcript_41591/m.134175 type:complete len:259 (+) Transcript_41591:1236-2012(+)